MLSQIDQLIVIEQLKQDQLSNTHFLKNLQHHLDQMIASLDEMLLNISEH